MDSSPGTSRCQHIKFDGQQCGAAALRDSTYCYFHDPRYSEERAAARRAGGRERCKKAVILPPETEDLPIKNRRQILKLLAQTINHVRTGKIDPKVANSIGYLAGIAMKIFEKGGDQKITVVFNRPEMDPNAISDSIESATESIADIQ